MTEKQIQAQAAKAYLSRLRGTVEQIQSLEDRIDESARRGGYGTGRRAATAKDERLYQMHKEGRV